MTAHATEHRTAPTARTSWPALTHRHVVIFTSGLFLLPNMLIAPALSPAAGLLLIFGCVASLWIVVRAARAGATDFLASPVEPATCAFSWLAAIALCVLGGEGHFFFANHDWLVRDAVLADLVQHKFPPFYDHQGNEFILRAPLGMYMAPAAVGKLLGLRAAHLALLAQNITILALMLTLLTSMVRGRKAVFFGIFLAFSGIEIVGTLIIAGAQFVVSGSFSWPLRMHQHLAAWNIFFQYTSHVAQIFWVPNHAFPGWWLAALSILHVRREIDSPSLIVSFAFLLFWSPLAMAGALPIVGYLLLRRHLGELFAPKLIAAYVAALCFLPVAAYLGADAGAVPGQWQVFHPAFWPFYFVFVLIQIPHAAIVGLFWQQLDSGFRKLAILSIGLLLLIPMYRLGQYNDFAMRASITPLALLAFVFGTIASNLQLRDGVKRVAAVAGIVILGCITPAMEIQRALTLKPFAISGCNLLTTLNQLEPYALPTNYFAKSGAMPEWLLRHTPAEKAITAQNRECWRDHSFSDLPMPVWREPERW